MTPTFGLLGLLAVGERYGYDLKREIDRDFSPFWQIDFGQLYRTLAKLARVGWVETSKRRGSGGPERKIYSITSSGRAAFASWLDEPAKDDDEFIVKVRLASSVGHNPASLLQSRRRWLEQENADRLGAYHAAQEKHDAGLILLAHAALNETQSSREALEMCETFRQLSNKYSRIAPRRRQLTITGSDDPMLLRLAELTGGSARVVGSLGGLLALARNETDVAGTHLLDLETGEYNIPFIKHLLPEENLLVVNLAFRENGLMLARGNPMEIRRLRDLTRRRVRFINRGRGTGTRLLLYSKLREAKIDPHTLPNWERTAATDEGVAAAILAGTADIGPGLRAVAEARGLDFIPLGEERYDLVLSRAVFESARGRSLIEALHDAGFRRAAAAFHGYDLARSGRIVARLKP